jgi:hypothetical protein
MQTVIETARFTSSAKSLLTGQEIENLKEMIARNPEAGELIKGTGGFRKLRLARKGGGKSGGYRVITFFYNDNIPVFLIDVYAKNQKENLTKAQENELRKIADILASYGG